MIKILTIISLLLVPFILLVRNPELALALLFNGALIFFYSIYKLGLETSRLMTGGFYAFLAFSYLLGGVILTVREQQKFRMGSTDELFICFFSLVFLSYFIFHTADNLAYTKIIYAPFLVIAPYFGIQFLSSEKTVKRFINYSILVAAVLIIPSFYELFYTSSFADASRFSMYEFSGGVNNPILYGVTFAILLIIIATRIMEEKGVKIRYLFLIIPSAYLLIRAGSRGTLVSFFATMVFYYTIAAKARLRTKLLVSISAILLFSGIYHYVPESTANFYKATLEQRYDPRSSVFQRIIMWQQAFSEFKQNPIWGVGLGNSVERSGFPHNIVLETLAELGIIGLFLFLSICYSTTKKAITFIRREKRQGLNLSMKISLLLFIFSFIEAMFSGYLTQQTHFFMSIALISSISKLKENSALAANP